MSKITEETRFTLTGPFDEKTRNLTAAEVLLQMGAHTTGDAIRLVVYPTNPQGRHDMTNTGYPFTIKIKR